MKDTVYRLIEDKIKAQEFKRSNEAILYLNTNSEFIKSLDLVKLLMIAKVEFTSKKNEIRIEKLDNSYKCLRCWNHFEEKDFDKDLELCPRCKKVVKNG